MAGDTIALRLALSDAASNVYYAGLLVIDAKTNADNTYEKRKYYRRRRKELRKAVKAMDKVVKGEAK